jgi:hypothetical protein
VVSLSCSGNPTAENIPTPTPTDATPEPTVIPDPDPGTFCPAGSVDSVCANNGAGSYKNVIDEAIERVIEKQPELFDASKSNGPGQPTVMNVHGYLQAVVLELQKMGYCAESRDTEHVSLKLGYDFSETYAIVSDRGFVRRDARSYTQTCNPSHFPASVDWIDRVRVAFYDIECPAGVTPPNNSSGDIPMGCVGYVTATPKDKNLKDVPADVHGEDIEWSFEGNAGNTVYIEHHPGQPFNKIVTPRKKGFFGMCATVMGVEGCMSGRVID